MVKVDTSFGPMFRIVARDCYVTVKEWQLVAVLGSFVRDWFVAFPYDALTCELAIRWGVTEMHGWEYESLLAISKRAELCRRRRTTKRSGMIRTRANSLAKFDWFEGWYDIVFVL